MTDTRCLECHHPLADFSYDAYCTRLDCWCHPHGACPVNANEPEVMPPQP